MALRGTRGWANAHMRSPSGALPLARVRAGSDRFLSIRTPVFFGIDLGPKSTTEGPTLLGGFWLRRCACRRAWVTRCELRSFSGRGSAHRHAVELGSKPADSLALESAPGEVPCSSRAAVIVLQALPLMAFSKLQDIERPLAVANSLRVLSFRIGVARVQSLHASDGVSSLAEGNKPAFFACKLERPSIMQYASGRSLKRRLSMSSPGVTGVP